MLFSYWAQPPLPEIISLCHRRQEQLTQTIYMLAHNAKLNRRI